MGFAEGHAPGTADDEQARRHLRSVAARARLLRTSSPEGDMVWRAWGEGPPLVLLHGGSGSWNHWIHTIPAFESERRVLACDLPGLGDSPTPRSPYSARSLGEIVAAGIEQVAGDPGPLDVVGFSFGGILGGQVAVLRPRRVRSLTIVGTPPFGLDPNGEAINIRPVSPALSFEEALPLHRRNLAVLMLADAERIDALALRAHHENLRRARLRSRKIARSGRWADTWREARCPVHGIWGSADATIHPDIEAIRRVFLDGRPHGTFELLDGVGHWCAYEDAERFNRVLRARLGLL